MESHNEYLYSPNLSSINDIGCEAVSDYGTKCNITFQLKTFGIETVDCKKYCINHIYNWFGNLFNTSLNYTINKNTSPKSSNSYSITRSINDIELKENVINLYCIIMNYKNNNEIIPLLIFNTHILIKHLNNKKALDKYYPKDYKVLFNKLNNYELKELKLIYLLNNENIFEKYNDFKFYYKNNLINNINIIKNNLFLELPNTFLITKKLI